MDVITPMDAQIQNTEVLEKSIEVESELGVPNMKIFEQKMTQEVTHCFFNFSAVVRSKRYHSPENRNTFR